jgi:flagellum-specific peptidoglycan hydrolase FlgJ
MNKGSILYLILGIFLLAACSSKRALVVNTEKEAPQAEKTRRDYVKVYQAERMASNDDYIATFKDIAMDEMKTSGIPASITLAQGLLESGGGNSELSLRSNNHFGIKCHKNWDGYRVYHDDDAEGECFRKYTHPMQSFKDHSLFLTGRQRYQFLFSYDKDDYKNWAQGLRKAGYATDRKYPDKLINLIERYQLYRYDALVLGNEVQVVEAVTQGEEKYEVQKGDTLYSISRKLDISVAELQRLNGLETNELYIGQVLYTKPMPKDF